MPDLPPLHRIKELREERGMSQLALATAAGLDKAAMSRIEKGKTHLNVPTMRQIAKALDLRPGDLLLDEDRSVGSSGVDAELLSIAHQMPPEERSRLIELAREMLALITRLLARGATGLTGNHDQIEAIVRFWNDGDDSDRSNVLSLMDSAQRFRPR